MLIQLSMLIITKVQKLPVQEYMIYYILAGLIGLLPALLLTAGGGCSKDTADEELRTQRKALLTAETPGVYRNGKPVFLFDRESHQLLADPSQCLFRIQDDEGRQYVSLRLEAMPAEGEKSAATISENMELGLGDAGDRIYGTK